MVSTRLPIAQAQEKGFEAVINHVHLNDPEKAILRVQTRTRLGGHKVPDNKVRERFPRTLKNLQIALSKAD